MRSNEFDIGRGESRGTITDDRRVLFREFVNQRAECRAREDFMGARERSCDGVQIQSGKVRPNSSAAEVLFAQKNRLDSRPGSYAHGGRDTRVVQIEIEECDSMLTSHRCECEREVAGHQGLPFALKRAGDQDAPRTSGGE
jgi:subtilase family serine protease